MNTKYLLIFIGVIVCMVGLYFFINRTPSFTNYPPRNSTVVAFGDSLIAGRGATEGNDFISLLSRKIKKPIVNLGVAGDTTDAGLARIDSVLDQKPGTVILLLGGNDYLRKVPEERTFNNLREIVRRLQAQGIFVIILGIRGGLLADHFDDNFESLSKQTHTAYIPNVLHGILADSRYMADAIHPNNAGYAIIAERIYSEIENYTIENPPQR